jgi:hypothetical protein
MADLAPPIDNVFVLDGVELLLWSVFRLRSPRYNMWGVVINLSAKGHRARCWRENLVAGH